MTKPPKTPAKVVMRYVPPNRLSKLLQRPGGTSRVEAIAAATENVEQLRESCMDTIEHLIVALERLVAARDQGPSERLEQLGRTAGQIINLSGTFGLAALGEASMRLCDLAMAFEERDVMMEEPLKIHVSAIRLFAPRGRSPGEMESQAVLSELQRLLTHLDITPAEVQASEAAAG